MGRSSRSRFVAASLAISAWLCLESAAHAGDDVRDVTKRVVDQWKLAGADAQALSSRFVFDDETLLVGIPESAGSACTYVAIVAPRGLSFHAKFADASSDPLAQEPGSRASSVAGVLELRRCDPTRPVRAVVVTSDAGRGVLEVVVGHVPRALPPLGSLIPERTGGALPPIPEAGVLPPLTAPEVRAEAAETRARRDGAQVAARSRITAGSDGTGEDELLVPEGCHRLELFSRDPRADNPSKRFRLDVDADLRDAASEQLLARDRTEAPDARLEACVGRATTLTVSFAGAMPGADVVVTRTTWPLPARVPAIWGPAARSKMARAMLARHVAVPADDPVLLAQGGSGTTPVFVPVEAGACYVAVVGTSHGRARALQLHAFIGAHESTDDRGAAEEAALTAFCVAGGERARLEVIARGSGVAWGLAVFRVRSGVWEAGR